MAKGNSGWGYRRIKGELKTLGIIVGRTTIKRILMENGIDPAPVRNKGMSWNTFLKDHWGMISAADFFTAETLSLFGLVRYYVLFEMDLKSRRVEIAGIIHHVSKWYRKGLILRAFVSERYYKVDNRNFSLRDYESQPDFLFQ
jgi:hypothetical protein